jgi:hypothetical protein
MVRTQIQLTEEQVQSLKKMADQYHVSMAELIRRGVDYLLKFSVISHEERKKRAIDATGRFRSGKRDISIKHDQYLTEDFGK